MTFMQLERILLETGRKSDGRVLIAYLLDSYDAGMSDSEADAVMLETGLKKTNISAVAKKLSDAGVVDLLYLDTRTEGSQLSAVRNGRWSKPYYRLTALMLSLYRRG